MSIELTTEQAEAVAAEGGNVVVIDPKTKAVYRLVPEDLFRKLQNIPYDASPWSAAEMAALAGEAFGKLDDTDYGDYLREKP